MPLENGKSEKHLQVYFVTQTDDPDEEKISQEMKSAFSNVTAVNLKPKWIRGEEIFTIDKNSVGNVFVFEEFIDEFFDNFVATYRHARIVSPKCLLTCLAENIPIPDNRSPVYNLVMNGLLVTAGVISADEKNKIKNLVGLMGGNCTDVLTKHTTHLITSSVTSEKYWTAKEANIPVLLPEWIDDLWERSLVNDINGIKELGNKYECPMFHQLNVTISQLPENEKMKVKKLIEDGGGIYSAELAKNVTNLLIVPAGRGEKFKFATRWKIPCVTMAWLEQSVAKKYALRFNNFTVKPANKCSTPISSYNQARIGTLIDTDDTDISAIPSDNGRTVVPESVNFDSPTQNALVQRIAVNVFKTPVKNHSRNDRSNTSENPTSYRNILNSIQVNDVKKIQHLLDGCKVYLMGFNADEEDKLRRILKYGGALRFTDLDESVTHVIVGNPNVSEIEALKRVSNIPHIVKLNWLSNSITKGCLETENNWAFFNENNEPSKQHSIKEVQQPSPLSKKGMQMLNPARQIPVNSHPIVGVDQILIEKYASFQDSENDDIPPVNVTKNSIHNEQPSVHTNDKLYFKGLRFAIVGHMSSVEDGIKNTLVEYGGTIVSNNHSVVDYTIMPFTNHMMRITSTEVVTLLWIEECLSSEAVVERKYYHRPVTVSDNINERALDDCVITFSSFNEFEKKYLENVARFLGAKCQEVLSKKESITDGISQTTHLVCSLAEGATRKYTAAKKWKLPIISKDWLLSCLNAGAKVPVSDYLINKDVAHNSPSITVPKKVQKPESTPRVRPEQTKLSSVSKPKNVANSAAIANVSSEVTNHHSSVMHPNDTAPNVSRMRSRLSFRSNAKPTPVERVPVTTPSIAEAVLRSTHRNVANNNQNEKNEEASAVKVWPSGFLIEMNAHASSSGKRKLDCQTTDTPKAPQGACFPKNKLLRYENQSSSPCEVVDWQDTLTDLSNMQADHVDSAEKDVDSQPDKSVEDAPAVVNRPTGAAKDKEPRLKEPRLDEPRLESHRVEVNAPSTRAMLLEKSSRSAGKIRSNFLISMPNSEKKILYEQIIKKLGGRVVSVFPTDCAESEKATHIIIDDLKKTEKLLCSIASGIWVLHSSYLDQCADAQKFLPEENFEWGNPLNEVLSTEASKDIRSIARAAHRWRIRITKGGLNSRPFIGMKAVIIGTGDDIINSLTRVVKSGGGSVLPICDILSCTHCLLKSPKVDLIPVPMKQLADRKIHCLLAVYLSDYLMNDPPPDVKNCYLEPYKRFFQML